jgi:hypothetical protein
MKRSSLQGSRHKHPPTALARSMVDIEPQLGRAQIERLDQRLVVQDYRNFGVTIVDQNSDGRTGRLFERGRRPFRLTRGHAPQLLSRRRFLMALMLAEEAHRLIGPTSFAHFAMRLFNVCWVGATWVWRAAGNLVGIVSLLSA